MPIMNQEARALSALWRGGECLLLDTSTTDSFSLIEDFSSYCLLFGGFKWSWFLPCCVSPLGLVTHSLMGLVLVAIRTCSIRSLKSNMLLMHHFRLCITECTAGTICWRHDRDMYYTWGLGMIDWGFFPLTCSTRGWWRRMYKNTTITHLTSTILQYILVFQLDYIMFSEGMPAEILIVRKAYILLIFFFFTGWSHK